MRITGIIFSITILTCSLAFSKTVRVPAGEPTIQAGIDAAVDFDTVLVADGTYTGDGNRDIDFGGKQIILMSENGPAFAIIDCEADSLNPHRGFYFHSGEGPQTTVEGFTVRGGYPAVIVDIWIGTSGAQGGAFWCENSSVTISNCWLEGNVAQTASGYDPFGSYFRSGRGGAIYANCSNVTLLNTAIWGNRVTENVYGYRRTASSAIYAELSYLDLVSCTVALNEDTDGAIVLEDSHLNLEKCIVAGNTGGGLDRDEESSVTMACSNVCGTDATDDVLVDQLLSDVNHSANPMFCSALTGDLGLADISPCAPANSPCGELVGAFGVGCSVTSRAVWHVSSDGNDASGDGSESNPFATIQHGIDAATHGDTVMVDDGVFTGVGNRDLDLSGKRIVVTSVNGPDYTIIDCQETSEGPHRGFLVHHAEDSLTAISGFTIKNSHYAVGGVIDCSGSSPTLSDMVLVNNEAQGGSGIRCNKSRAVIARCTLENNTFGYGTLHCREANVIVSENTMTNNNGRGVDVTYSRCLIQNNLIRHNQEQLGAGVFVYESQATILSNVIEENAAQEFGGGIGSIRSDLMVIDNIIRGNTLPDLNYWRTDRRGGGIYHSGRQSIMITGNEITGNMGEGAWCEYVDSATIADNVITGNSVLRAAYERSGGGGIHFDGNWALIASNQISSNTGYTGGAVYTNGEDVTIENCTILNNRGDVGGGMYIKGEGLSTVSECIVVDNHSVRGAGGGICLDSSDALVRNCTILANGSAVGQGGSVWLIDASPALENCIIALHPGLEHFAIFPGTAGIPNLSSCDVFGQVDGDWTGCLAGQENIQGNFSADPLFCDAANDNYHVSVLSPCAATNNSSGSLIGALPAACGYYECGDVDLDGELTEADIEALQAAYFHTLPLYFPTPTADMDCNGTININDLAMLAGYYYGYGPAPCCDPPPKRPDQPGREETGGPGH